MKIKIFNIVFSKIFGKIDYFTKELSTILEPLSISIMSRSNRKKTEDINKIRQYNIFGIPDTWLVSAMIQSGMPPLATKNEGILHYSSEVDLPDITSVGKSKIFTPLLHLF